MYSSSRAKTGSPESKLILMLSSDPLFLALPLHLRHLIDKAFDLTVDPNHIEYAKVASDDTIPRQNQGISAGGFLVESEKSLSNTSGDDILDCENDQWRPSMPLSSIPSALQLLDLPPDDPEILLVFANAASGWISSSITPLGGDLREKYVRREDWRSVCAVLLEHRNSEISNDDERLPRMSKSEDWQDVEVNSECCIDPESGSDSAGSSSDDYVEHNMGRRKRVQNQNHQFVSSLHLDLEQLSSRQKETCLKTFALFFPDVPHHQLADHRIMIKDLQRVSKLLGEKIKAEEMVEMLNTFSASPDKSVSFDDFSRIMVVAKLT